MKRKIDKRTLSTQNSIKDAFLELVKTNGYNKTNVTAICKTAAITRATFYIHFANIDDVLETVLNDALVLTDNMPWNKTLFQKIIQSLESNNSIENTLLPACQKIIDIPKYKPLFQDKNLTPAILQTLFKYKREEMIAPLMAEYKLSKKMAEKLFMFILTGTYQVNKSMNWEKNNEWYKTQAIIFKFIIAGLDSLKPLK